MISQIAEIFVGIVGFLFMSEATLGVAIIGFACVIAIVGRIQQGSVQHKGIAPDYTATAITIIAPPTAQMI